MPVKRKMGTLVKAQKLRRTELVRKTYAALRKVLKEFDVPELYYSIGSQVDDSVCIEYRGGKWIVYEGTRGHKINVRSFDSAYEAGCDLFESVAIGEKKLLSMRIRFKKMLRRFSDEESIQRSRKGPSVLARKGTVIGSISIGEDNKDTIRVGIGKNDKAATVKDYSPAGIKDVKIVPTDSKGIADYITAKTRGKFNAKSLDAVKSMFTDGSVYKKMKIQKGLQIVQISIDEAEAGAYLRQMHVRRRVKGVKIKKG